MSYQPQVQKSHYEGSAYRSSERWNSYWHQLELVRSAKPASVLEVGVGEGVVARHLQSGGITVTTVDIAEDLHPDVVGSVTALPFADASFDLVLAAEILEHIEFSDVSKALSEIARVAGTHAMISVPRPGWIFSIIYKLPLFPRIELLFQIPFFWKTHIFNGEHYWELGKKGYPVSRFIHAAEEAGLELVSYKKYADDPGHRFFLFKKKTV
ncbi:MAG: methyltransferase domain-containing protein [Candidatus Adlerbacteria bacterium]